MQLKLHWPHNCVTVLLEQVSAQGFCEEVGMVITGPDLVDVNGAVRAHLANIGLRNSEMLSSGVVDSLGGLQMHSLVVGV